MTPTRLRVAYRALPDGMRADVAIVIDVLRATTTALAALEAGVPSIRAVAELEHARAMASRGMLVAGERRGLRVQEFAFGNSPVEIAAAGPLGRTLVLCSTNGSRALSGVTARAAFAGCIRNAAASARAATRAADHGEGILLQGSGQDGKPTAEDEIAAGAIIAALTALPLTLEEDEEARRAHNAWLAASAEPAEALLATPHGSYLASLGLTEDVRYAAALDASPNVVAVRDGVLTLVRRERG
ncbi:MAG TPA: 2-phosphosulfolactate phosphatase [Candidatus Dormibacteraeota bacterium]|nr:2-phosphosulfolactate phosphatase [Candidatus Dormibacteraeota bacterium]